jgi:DMSO/TMAO reductase YedYZ molybdopterin-dependent catalytic subunit/mono/diheme cytochrome c family protein
VWTRRVFATRAAGSIAVWVVGCEREHAVPRREDARPYDGAPAFEITPVVGDELPDGLRANEFDIHSRTPLTMETRRSALGREIITPTPQLFVRNNLPLPPSSIVADAEAWVLQVWGVKRPRTFTLAQLRELGEQSVTAVLQCSGNGRRFFAHGPSGSQWGVGAAGCVTWTGVPVRAVLEAAGGPLPGTTLLTATGGDPIPPLPAGMSEDLIRVERSIPIEKAMDDAMLAWAIGGAPLPLTHGAPLRLVVPGYYGVNNIKYVKAIMCAQQESRAKIQRAGYRMRPIGDKGHPSQPTMWRMEVKSWVSSPGGDGEPVLAGLTTIRGVAFSGERGIRSVEVSLDGGASWRPAALRGPDLGPNAWRTFELQATLRPGKHSVCSRATDTAGDVQRREREENERGYGNTSWLDHALAMEAFETLPERPPQREPAQARDRGPVSLSAPAERGREVFLRRAKPQCGTCHAFADAEVGMPIGPNLDDLKLPPERIRATVENGVGVMPGYRDILTPSELDEIARYVFEARKR